MAEGVLAACLFFGGAQARPPEQMELPDWNNTPVEDHDLGHGVHMLESFGDNIGVLAGDNGVLAVLQKHDQDLSNTLQAMAPFYRVFASTLGTGRWFDVYVANLTSPLPNVGG